MNAERWQQIKKVFDQAQEVEAARRSEFLETECAGDADLRREVEKLLVSFDEADTSFMENPAAGEVASFILERQTAFLNQMTGEVKNGSFVAGMILDDRYRIVGLLGRGGMGEVYKAEDLKLDQTVALKFLPDKLEKNQAALKRFVGEVKTARQVAHPNVCKVFDIGVSGGRHFLSMEFVDGDDLSSLLRRIGRLPSDKAAEISRQICFGLHAIHEAGILHRDLKPANVIIDSRGKAKITDFGIAGVEREISGAKEIIGTPAYMSPEQITGGEITQRSDVYSLGLLLYEIFTGRQSFRADSIGDLIEKHKSETPTNPSAFVENIDPLVEKTINRCLAKNPANRLPTALRVALMLPGGNPLEAAIAAGETPSPEMIAAAPKRGALKPALAVALLIGIFVSLAFLIFVSKHFTLYRRVPLEKSPPVLAERGREVAAKFGYAAATDSYYGFIRENDYLDYLGKNDPSPARWENLRDGQPAVYQFWYRQSASSLAPFSGDYVTTDDPPNNKPEMAYVRLDTRGRLIFFEAVPPSTMPKQNRAGDFDWIEVFREAGFEIENFREIESEQTPPQAFDRRKSWAGVYPEQTDILIKVEAAAYGGKLTYFQIIEPWDAPVLAAPYQGGVNTAEISSVVLLSIFFSILVVGIFLAVRNVRGGRGDFRGAFRVAFFLFVVLMTGWVFGTHHVAAVEETMLLITGLQGALFWSCFAGMMYLAFEPYLRKHQPERVIAWNRLLAGDWRDPLVGRDVLIGVFAGMCLMLLGSLRYFVPVWLGEPMPVPFTMSNPGGRMLDGTAGFPVLFTGQIAASLVMGFMVSFLILFFTILTRRKLLGSLAAWFLIFAFAASGELASGEHPATLILAVVFPTVLIFTASRFGVPATIATITTYHLLVFYPITTEFSAWYAGDFILCLIFLAMLAVFAFHYSLADQPIFQGKILRE